MKTKTKRQILAQKWITSEEHLRLKKTMQITGFRWDCEKGLYKKDDAESIKILKQKVNEMEAVLGWIIK